MAARGDHAHPSVAAELAVDTDVGRSAVGVAALDALEESALLQADDQALISAVLDAVVEPAVGAYDEGDFVQAVESVAKTLKVNRAQVRAARLIVSRASRGLGEASPAVRAI